MIQKLTASFLLWMMSMTVVMAQPGLRYCLCTHEIFLGQCKCPEPDVPTPPATSCCSECSECQSSPVSTAEQKTCPLPGECIVELFFDLEDCSLPSPSDSEGISETSLKSPSYLLEASLVPSRNIRDAAHDVRGPPPPSHPTHSVPLFLRHLVFLL